MAEKKRTAADGAAIAALIFVALVVNVSLAAFTDVAVPAPVGHHGRRGNRRRPTAYAIVSRRARSRQ